MPQGMGVRVPPSAPDSKSGARKGFLAPLHFSVHVKSDTGVTATGRHRERGLVGADERSGYLKRADLEDGPSLSLGVRSLEAAPFVSRRSPLRLRNRLTI